MMLRGPFAAALLLLLSLAVTVVDSFSSSRPSPTIVRVRAQETCKTTAAGCCAFVSSSEARRCASSLSSASAACSTELVVNDESVNNTVVPSDESLPSSPPLSFKKFVTMQDKRAVVTVTYSGLSGLRPFFLTFAKKIKAQNPDVVIDQRILPPVEQNGEPVFSILVDGKLVIGKGQSKKQGVRMSSSSDTLAGGLSVFVSAEDITTAIAKARKRRRPQTAYSPEDESSKNSAVRLEMLMKGRESQNGDGPWNTD